MDLTGAIAPGLPPDHGHDHLVEFYETDAFLTCTVADFVVPALRDGDAAIVAATPEHREGFAKAIRAAGIDLEAAIEGGRYLAFDAAGLLPAFMVNGAPDPKRFREAITPVIDRAAVTGREVRVYGEMVALLWAAGDVASAIALEDLWNDLASTRRFSLLCAYPIRAFDDGASAEFKRICDQHTAVIPAESYSLVADAAEQHRVVAYLQHQTASLGAELSRLRRGQETLAEMAYVDSLTGLANRRAFDSHLEREWALTLRDGIDSFVVAADLDGFKQVNDRWGHAVGDDVLVQFGAALRLAARSTDILARIGGDEFAVLLIRCDERAAHSFSSRLQGAMTEKLPPRFGSLSVSLGHASLLQSTSGPKALDRADLAMLAKKHSAYRHTRTR